MSDFTESQCEQAEQQESARKEFIQRVAGEIRAVCQVRFTYDKLTEAEIDDFVLRWVEIADDCTWRAHKECEEVITSYRGAEEREHEAIESRRVTHG